MVVKNFEDLRSWESSQIMAVKIYSIFRKNRDFGFRDQICRAAVSVSNNIAEGFNRKSKKDFIRYLIYGVGSCNEVKSMVYLAYRLEYINSVQKTELLQQCNKVTNLIRGLIRYLMR